MKQKGTFLVPTVGGIDEYVERHKNDVFPPEVQKQHEAFLQGIRNEI